MTEASQPGNSSLELGISAFKADNKGTARKHLADAIQQDPQNETAWLYMAAAIDDPQRRQQCLHRVLAINPNNQVAQRELNKTLPPAPITPVPSVAQTVSVVPAIIIMLIMLALYWGAIGFVQLYFGMVAMESQASLGLLTLFDAAMDGFAMFANMIFIVVVYKRSRRAVTGIMIYGVFMIIGGLMGILGGAWINIVPVLMSAGLIALVQIGKAEFTA